MARWAICCRCGQPNEGERAYCWVCFRSLKQPAKVEDYRKLLGVSDDDSDDQVRQAYRRLAVKYHPDKNPLQKEIAEAQFKMVNQAYETLSGHKATSIATRTHTRPTAATREGPSFEELQSILGGFAFRTKPTFIERLSSRNVVMILVGIGIAVTAMELLRALFSFFGSPSGNFPQ